MLGRFHGCVVLRQPDHDHRRREDQQGPESGHRGRDIILVEDILDSGVTLHYLKDYLSVRRPASITIATLLDKPARRKAPIHAAYAGFEVPDAFVVGYGLDYAEKYRNLPYIGVLKPEVYST